MVNVYIEVENDFIVRYRFGIEINICIKVRLVKVVDIIVYIFFVVCMIYIMKESCSVEVVSIVVRVEVVFIYSLDWNISIFEFISVGIESNIVGMRVVINICFNREFVCENEVSINIDIVKQKVNRVYCNINLCICMEVRECKNGEG